MVLRGLISMVYDVLTCRCWSRILDGLGVEDNQFEQYNTHVESMGWCNSILVSSFSVNGPEHGIKVISAEEVRREPEEV